MRKQLSPPKGDFISSCNLWRSINPAPGVTAFAHAKLGGNGCCADQTAQEIFNTVKESFMWCAEAWLALSWFASRHERTLRDTSLKVWVVYCRRWLLDDENFFSSSTTSSSMKTSPTCANGLRACPCSHRPRAMARLWNQNIFTPAKIFFIAEKKFSDTKNNLWNNMDMLQQQHGHVGRR